MSSRCPEMMQLRHELGLSPVRHRPQFIAGIAHAIDMIEAGHDYPFSFVRYHVTGFRPRASSDDALLSGSTLIEALVELAESLTADAPLPADAWGGRWYDADRLAQRFNVSLKTISRWRKRGLVAVWRLAEDGRSALAFASDAVQRFVARNLDLVRRGSSFKLMTSAERAAIVARARELAAAGEGTLHAVTLRLSSETGRAVETIRYTLRRFDEENPDRAIFDNAERARSIDEREVIYQAFVDGEAVAQIARRFGKSERETRQILSDVRTMQLSAESISYVFADEFVADGAEAEILGAEPACADDAADVSLSRVPASLPPYLRELYRTPLLGAAAERFLFRKMNYLLHRAEAARRRLAADAGAAGAAQAMESLLAQASEVKNRIIQANLRLVVSVARRHMGSASAANFFELVSDGNLALMRAVERFDYSRGFRFSTYATWAIMRAFARSVPEEYTQSDRFRTGHEEILASVRDGREADPSEQAGDGLRLRVANGLASLDERERRVVERHYGIGATDGQTLTLDEIGREFGISKERVRQIEIRALKKLRQTLGAEGVELLAG